MVSYAAVRRSLLRFAANALLLAGGLLLVTVGAAYGYGIYMGRQAQRAAGPLYAVTPSEASLRSLLWEQVPDLAANAAAAAPPPSPKAYPPALRIVIPRIGTDSPVVEVGIVKGEYEVPAFKVGHYRGTANPKEPGNGVFAGHVSSIRSGNVFADLDKLEPGDEVYLFTAEGQTMYQVKGKLVVPNTALRVMAPTAEPAITLITCTGEWDWRTRDYTHRLVVVAQLYQDAARPPLAIQPR